MATKPRKPAPATELVSAEIERFLREIRRRPVGGPSVVIDDQGDAHLRGSWHANGDRQALNYTAADVKEFRRLAARAYGWPGERLHLNELRDDPKTGKPRWFSCWCERCAPIRRELARYCTDAEAEEMLACALGTGKPWFLPASGRERIRVHRARKTERGEKCSRCPNPPAPGKTVCDPCNEGTKARVYASRARARELRQKA